jgi:thiamine-monophosphate kinase
MTSHKQDDKQDDKLLDEFAFITEWLSPLADNKAAARLGDDAAQVAVPDGHELVISTDMLVANVHFPADAKATLIANRMLACNISDLAAKGAQPYGCLLTLGVAENWDSAFLQKFVQALGAGLKTYDMQLWGGDTVRARDGFAGLTVHGLVPQGEMLTRSGAQDGDDVYVTGTIGDGFLDLADLGSAYAAPMPPLAFGQAARNLATAAIDVSDGLMADLDHICRASVGGIDIEANAIPLSEAGRAHGDLAALVCGGDDLQIAFTAQPSHADILGIEAEKHRIALTRIGKFTANAAPKAILRAEDGQEIALQKRGFRHF